MASATRTTTQRITGWVVVAGASVFVLAAVATDLLETDHNIVTRRSVPMPSARLATSWRIGFFALAIAHAALAVALARRPVSEATGQWMRIGVAGLGIVALAVLFVALFPANGLGKVGGFSVHGTAATIAFVVFPPTAILLAVVFRGDRLLRSVAPAALIIALVNTLALVVFGVAVVGHLPWIWLAEKADSLVTAVWLVVVGSASPAAHDG